MRRLVPLLSLCLGLFIYAPRIEADAQEPALQPPLAAEPAAVVQVAPDVQPPLAVVTQQPDPADVLPPPTLTSDFGIPEGLKTPAEVLLPRLGFGPAYCFPLTPTTCFDVGYKCYVYGLYDDAFAFADHGLKLSNHARLYLLKAMCELHLKRCEDAKSTLVKYRMAALRPAESVGLLVAREKLNDPMRVRLELLLSAWDRSY